MISDVRAKKANPIISGMVPRMSESGGKFATTWPFTRDAETVAKDQHVDFVDHTKYTIERWQGEGVKRVEGYFPNFPQDKTHTNSAGARLNAETFVVGSRCAKTKLSEFYNPKGAAMKQKC
jgi:rhamnogalacturonan acetylesterase